MPPSRRALARGDPCTCATETWKQPEGGGLAAGPDAARCLACSSAQLPAARPRALAEGPPEAAPLPGPSQMCAPTDRMSRRSCPSRPPSRTQAPRGQQEEGRRADWAPQPMAAKCSELLAPGPPGHHPPATQNQLPPSAPVTYAQVTRSGEVTTSPGGRSLTTCLLLDVTGTVATTLVPGRVTAQPGPPWPWHMATVSEPQSLV
ncbi:translation initiation factor IF-2-like [Rousettus aegyptiacus]|uniref:translation initiation factor IF-2-like n=1 Tax=Rousettus aegyptiacus TaxID=9407 RepID=UPI00168CF544|nr:translation initiation factor IF-2-like [Rousettus aegyptiacus]